MLPDWLDKLNELFGPKSEGVAEGVSSAPTAPLDSPQPSTAPSASVQTPPAPPAEAPPAPAGPTAEEMVQLRAQLEAQGEAMKLLAQRPEGVTATQEPPRTMPKVNDEAALIKRLEQEVGDNPSRESLVFTWQNPKAWGR